MRRKEEIFFLFPYWLFYKLSSYKVLMIPAVVTPVKHCCVAIRLSVVLTSTNKKSFLKKFKTGIISFKFFEKASII
jgi:hypothetical protein